MPKSTLSKGSRPLIDGIISGLKKSLVGRISTIEENGLLYAHELDLGFVEISIKFNESGKKPHDKRPVSRGGIYAIVKCENPSNVKIPGRSGVVMATKSEKAKNGKVATRPKVDKLIDYMTELVIAAGGGIGSA